MHVEALWSLGEVLGVLVEMLFVILLPRGVMEMSRQGRMGAEVCLGKVNGVGTERYAVQLALVAVEDGFKNNFKELTGGGGRRQ